VFSYRDGQTNRKEQIGTVEHFPTKSAAQKACESLHKHINNGNLRPRTLADLMCRLHPEESSEGSKKAHSTREMYGSYIDVDSASQDGYALSEVSTVEVKSGLGGLSLAYASKAKIRSIMSAIFNHAGRHEWAKRNPITLVRGSAMREKVPDVLTAEEIEALLAELQRP